MDAIGAQELPFPALLPREPYEATGRWTEYGDNIFRLKDRKGGDYLLGPTHEEMFTLTVKDLYSSYKDLPLSIYQIQTKYRDEARPRAGLLRGREFIMKDSYSFDVDDAGLEASYQLHRDAYIRIFDRLGFAYVIVAAMSGAMGGSRSEEFLATAENGEDTYVRCTHCDYAANVEAVRVPVPDAVPYDGTPAAHVEDTPDTPTIETLVTTSTRRSRARTVPGRPATPSRTSSSCWCTPTAPASRSPSACPATATWTRSGSRPRCTPPSSRAFDEAAFAANPALVKGYIGPRALGEEGDAKVRYLLDPRVVEGTRWVTGADEPGRHVIDLVAGRDFTADGTIEAAEVRAGDVCPSCGEGVLETARGIEMGHIFALGRKFADALGLKVLDQLGKQVTVTMGSYGVGVSRAVAAVAEGNHDEVGLVWPRELSPADVHVVATGKDEEVFAKADEVTTELERRGVSVLYDDRRKVSPGVKFKDAELVGVPTIVVIGRNLAEGVIEVRDRRSGAKRDVAVAEAVDAIVDEVRGASAS